MRSPLDCDAMHSRDFPASHLPLAHRALRNTKKCAKALKTHTERNSCTVYRMGCFIAHTDKYSNSLLNVKNL